MLDFMIAFFKSVINDPVIQNDLEAYINIGNPKNSGDVERLEKEFNTQRRHLARYYSE